MPQLQVVNTGGNFMSTALGNIGQGFIEAYGKRAEQARNDEIFSRIKSKYGPNVDADTLYKDVLQSSGMDQSYKNDTLGLIKQLAALEHDKEKTKYDQIRLQQYQEDLGIRTRNAATGEQNAKNRAKQLQIQEQRVIDAREKNSKNLPKAFSDYTNQALKNTNYSADSKAYIDDVGARLLKENANNPDYTVAQALTEALGADKIRTEIIKNSMPPKPPKSVWGSANQQEINQAAEALYDYLKNAYDAGITSQRDLLKIAENGAWSANDANKVIQKVIQKPKDILGGPTQDQVNALF